MAEQHEGSGLPGSGSKKRPGRPPHYDAEQALEAALQVFWARGFAATSLDNLSAATGMNRPSLYNAFGDKRDIYRKALLRYRDQLSAALLDVLSTEGDVLTHLRRMIEQAIETYSPKGRPARGCFMVATAGMASRESGEIAKTASLIQKDIDDALRQRMSKASELGELAPEIDYQAVAYVVSALLHSLAVRARAGEGRGDLDEFADAGLRFLALALGGREKNGSAPQS
jgi:AcrR family transcriptional regulator